MQSELSLQNKINMKDNKEKRKVECSCLRVFSDPKICFCELTYVRWIAFTVGCILETLRELLKVFVQIIH